MRYEKIIPGQIRCEKAPQVVRAWQGHITYIRFGCFSNFEECEIYFSQ